MPKFVNHTPQGKAIAQRKSSMNRFLPPELQPRNRSLNPLNKARTLVTIDSLSGSAITKARKLFRSNAKRLPRPYKADPMLNTKPRPQPFRTRVRAGRISVPGATVCQECQAGITVYTKAFLKMRLKKRAKKTVQSRPLMVNVQCQTEVISMDENSDAAAI